MVIAIIAILAAMLLPALTKAKDKARQIACINNLKQLQIGWQMYVDDNRNNLPENWHVGSGALSAASPVNSWVTGNTQAGTNTTDIRDGVIYSYVGSEAVYHCPGDFSTAYNVPMPRLRSYAMDVYMGGDIVADAVKKYSQILGPAGVFVFLDENEKSIDDGMFYINRAPGATWPNLASDRHNRGADLSFADGHCERFRWKAPKIFITWTQPASGDDLDDLRKLQAALPQ